MYSQKSTLKRLVGAIGLISILTPVAARALHVTTSKVERDAGAPAKAGESAPAIWRPGQRALTYWINIGSFCRDRPEGVTCARGQAVSENLEAAAKAWRDACPECGISITRVTTPEKATFVVRYVPFIKLRGGGNRPPSYIARAFYPKSAPADRVLRISSLYFTSKSGPDPVGVLRHELGHVLGYSHEHAHAGQNRRIACGWEPESLPAGLHSIAVTAVDAQSVMGYPCGHATSRPEMQLSPMDIAGHRKVYGEQPPRPDLNGHH